MRKWFGVRDTELEQVDKNYIIKAEYRSKFRTVWPFFMLRGADVLNVFRFLPAKLVEDNVEELTPFRLSDEPHDFGPWLYAAVLANIGGRNGVTFLIGNRQTDDEITIREKPFFVLYENARRLLYNHVVPHWKKYNLISGFCLDDQAVPLLQKPALHYFSFGLVLQHPYYKFNGTFYGVKETDPIFVVIMRSALGSRLMDLLDAMHLRSESSDLIDLDRGKHVLIYRSKQPDSFHFDVSLKDTFQNISPSLTAVKDVIVKKLGWWDILHIPSVQQQVEYICESALPAEVIYRCLKDRFGQFIPEEIVDKANYQMKHKDELEEKQIEYDDLSEVGDIPSIPNRNIADMDDDIKRELGL